MLSKGERERFFDALLTGYAVGLDQVIVSADNNGRLSAQFVVRG